MMFLLLNLVASELGHTAGMDIGRSELPSVKQSLLGEGPQLARGDEMIWE